MQSMISRVREQIKTALLADFLASDKPLRLYDHPHPNGQEYRFFIKHRPVSNSIMEFYLNKKTNRLRLEMLNNDNDSKSQLIESLLVKYDFVVKKIDYSGRDFWQRQQARILAEPVEWLKRYVFYLKNEEDVLKILIEYQTIV